MIRRTGQYLFGNPDEIGFQNYLVHILSLFIAALGLVGTIINLVLQLDWWLILSTLIPSVIFTPIYLYGRFNRKYIVSRVTIILFSLLIVNIQWFLNFGSYGPILFLFVVLESFIIIFLKGREKVFFTVFIFVNITLLFIIEYYYPSLTGNYENETQRLIDIYTSGLIYLLICMLLLNLAMRFYQRKQEEAQVADKLKSAFLANMSHEIRTPMNGILGFAELLRRPGLTGEQQQNYLSIIEKSGVRMLTLINNLVDISKIEAGLMEVEISETDIGEVMSYVYTFFGPQAETKKIKLFISPDNLSRNLQIYTDKDKVSAILINLVKNAINYTDDGFVEFGYRIDNQLIEFYVKDTGVGIPLSRQQIIFERFIQADFSDRMARQGAGLGLSISKAYVNLLKGKIWLKSEVGEGSTFFFTLPFTPVIQQNTQNMSEFTIMEPQKNSSNSGVLTIMIVEDDPESVVLIEEMLGKYSREFIKVNNGYDAVEICRKRPDIDIILMDIKLPLMNGYEATRKIREFNKSVFIIAQTAYSLSGDREKTLEAGCNEYISKPIKYLELIALVDDFIKTRKG